MVNFVKGIEDLEKATIYQKCKAISKMISLNCKIARTISGRIDFWFY